jgi:hypothetical protein
MFGDGDVEVGARQIEGQGHLTALALGLDGGVQRAGQAGAVGVVPERQPVTLGELLSRAHESGPDGGRQPLVQGGLDTDHALATPANAVEPGRDHPGVVEHQDVAGAQQARQVADMQITQRLTRFDQQQACGFPGGSRPERDALLGKFEIEIGDMHEVGVKATRTRARQAPGVLEHP